MNLMKCVKGPLTKTTKDKEGKRRIKRELGPHPRELKLKQLLHIWGGRRGRKPCGSPRMRDGWVWLPFWENGGDQENGEIP